MWVEVTDSDAELKALRVLSTFLTVAFLACIVLQGDKAIYEYLLSNIVKTGSVMLYVPVCCLHEAPVEIFCKTNLMREKKKNPLHMSFQSEKYLKMLISTKLAIA